MEFKMFYRKTVRKRQQNAITIKR